jgi:hypothetical protein
MTFNYKKYSLEKLEEWVHDSLSCEDASPQEIYDVIKKVVEENYYTYKCHTERCYELLALLNGNGKDHITFSGDWSAKNYTIDPYGNNVKVCDKDDSSPECKKSWSDFWEETYCPEKAKDNGMRPWGHSDMEYLTAEQKSKYSKWYTEEELNAMCDKAASDEEKDKCREYNLREAEYYNKRAELDSKNSYQEAIDAGWTMTGDGFWIPPQKEDKVVKWQLPVEIDGISGEYYIQFPDDLMKAANINENDLVEWIDRKDGTFELRKVNTESKQSKCA